jgi:hypothetical protein
LFFSLLSFDAHLLYVVKVCSFLSCLMVFGFSFSDFKLKRYCLDWLRTQNFLIDLLCSV